MNYMNVNGVFGQSSILIVSLSYPQFERIYVHEFIPDWVAIFVFVLGLYIYVSTYEWTRNFNSFKNRSNWLPNQQHGQIF